MLLVTPQKMSFGTRSGHLDLDLTRRSLSGHLEVRTLMAKWGGAPSCNKEIKNLHMKSRFKRKWFHVTVTSRGYSGFQIFESRFPEVKEFLQHLQLEISRNNLCKRRTNQTIQRHSSHIITFMDFRTLQCTPNPVFLLVGKTFQAKDDSPGIIQESANPVDKILTVRAFAPCRWMAYNIFSLGQECAIGLVKNSNNGRITLVHFAIARRIDSLATWWKLLICAFFGVRFFKILLNFFN